MPECGIIFQLFFFFLTFCFACAVLFLMPVAAAATRFTYFLSKKKKKKASAVYCSPASGTCGAKQARFTCFCLLSVFPWEQNFLPLTYHLKMIDALGMITASCRFRVTRLEFSEIPLH